MFFRFFIQHLIICYIDWQVNVLFVLHIHFISEIASVNNSYFCRNYLWRIFSWKYLRRCKCLRHQRKVNTEGVLVNSIYVNILPIQVALNFSSRVMHYEIDQASIIRVVFINLWSLYKVLSWDYFLFFFFFFPPYRNHYIFFLRLKFV